MVPEHDAEQVENLALIPVGRLPNARDGVDLGIRAAHLALHANSFVLLDGVQVIDYFEPGLRGMPIDGRDPAQASVQREETEVSKPLVENTELVCGELETSA